MQTLNINISDNEFAQFGFTRKEFEFDELIQIVKTKITRENLDKCVSLAEQYGLTDMTIEDISKEVNAVRKNA